MKKKLVNKKVVNSIGIGLLAVMTAANPIVAQAAELGELDGQQDPDSQNTPDEVKTSEVVSDAKDEITDAKEVVSNEDIYGRSGRECNA